MPKKVNTDPSERTRVRFIMVDFDGASSDLQQIAQTFANAVKATHPVPVALPPAQNGHPPALPHAQPAEPPGLFDQLEPVEQEAETPPAPRPQNGAKKKPRLRSPVVLTDLNLTDGPVPFEKYVEEQAPKDHSKRYLAISQWLKEYRSITDVTADHVYTCYRFLGLSVPDDVLGVFRGMKKEGWVVSGAERGTFRITHVGEKQLNHARKE